MAGRQLSNRNKGSATLGPAGARIPQQGLAAALVAALAFCCYYATLLPGLDLGDSASFQTGVASLTLTPRQGYPLYHALGSVFVWLHPGEPARALNFASAVWGALAAGAAAYVGTQLTGSALAGVGSGLFLAFSYTFWTQAVTAEVYTLHLLLAGAATAALLFWSEQPDTRRLALFYAVFALGFGNHLSTVLLLPAFAVFLLMVRRRGPGDPLAPRLMMMAGGIAAAGALQYAWNFRGLWDLPEPPASLQEAVSKFWFDVTKSDWRASLVNTISEAGRESRPAMYWFDIQQQFGIGGVALALIGIVYVTFRSPTNAVLLILMFAANLMFAWTYNVGDAYVFFLPSHYVVALCAGAGIAAIARSISTASGRPIAVQLGAAALLAYPAWRGYDTFPAADRSWDRRAEQVLDEFTSVDGAVFGVDTNWQLQNAFQYFMRERKPHVPWFLTEELTWLEDIGGEPIRSLIESNRAIGRSVIVTPLTLKTLGAHGYKPNESDVVRLNDSRTNGLLKRIEGTRRGTIFVFGILRPDREFAFDDAELSAAWRSLTDNSEPMPDPLQFAVVVGRVGEKPLLVKTGSEPFRVRLRVDGFDVDIRMESWLPTDTIRRAGFGHVIVDRQHLLTLERGLSFVAVPAGMPAYGSGLFAPIPGVLLRPERLN